MKYKEIVKETYPGSGIWTHSHWVDENGTVIPCENMVIPLTEYQQMKQDLSDTKACIDEILMGGITNE